MFPAVFPSYHLRPWCMQHSSVAKQIAKHSYLTRSKRDARGNNLAHKMMKATIAELTGSHHACGESSTALLTLRIWAKGRGIGRGRRNSEDTAFDSKLLFDIS